MPYFLAVHSLITILITKRSAALGRVRSLIRFLQKKKKKQQREKVSIAVWKLLWLIQTQKWICSFFVTPVESYRLLLISHFTCCVNLNNLDFRSFFFPCFVFLQTIVRNWMLRRTIRSFLTARVEVIIFLIDCLCYKLKMW